MSKRQYRSKTLPGYVDHSFSQSVANIFAKCTEHSTGLICSIQCSDALSTWIKNLQGENKVTVSHKITSMALQGGTRI